jgi:hypothetical protein
MVREPSDLRVVPDMSGELVAFKMATLLVTLPPWPVSPIGICAPRWPASEEPRPATSRESGNGLLMQIFI